MSEALPVKVISVDSKIHSGKNDVDRHNKPRLRRSLIISSLLEKYKDIVHVETISAEVASKCDLVELFSSVHDVHMVQFLVNAWTKWVAMGPDWYDECCQPGWKNVDAGPPPFIPCHASFRRDGIERPSKNIMGAFGYYCTDLMTPIVGSLVTELQEDATIICSSVDAAFDGKRTVVYALTTHPGHHVNYDNFGGYCYLNNAALCARLMQRRLGTGSRVAIIDIDYHCGNGTASIFYKDPDIFFTSIHCDPEIEYPFNAGYEDQVGEGPGTNTTLHIPLDPGATWEEYKPALQKAMKAIMDFGVGGLVVSMGLDTYEGDSVAVSKGGFKLSGADYHETGKFIGRFLKNKEVPTIFVQEGGYKMDVIGEAAADVIGGFSKGATVG